MADIVDDLADLHRQATHEPSHYYAAKTAERAIREIERLRAALTRLGSVEAFDVSRVIDARRDKELIMRIDFARDTLEQNAPQKQEG